MEYFICLFCQKRCAFNVLCPFCPRCREPLLCDYPTRPRGFYPKKGLSLDRYRDFLPLSRINPALSLGEGNTPLVELTSLRKKFNLPLIFAKNETQNPTASFKDRGTSVAVQKAVALGFRRIGTVSTGNMAASTAAYGAKAGVETFILLKEGASRDKIMSAAIFRPHIFSVKGDYGDLFYRSFSLGQKHRIYFMNSVDPFRIEGYKVTGFEIFSQLDEKIPDWIFAPVSSGGHLIGLMRAFLDLKSQGWTQKMPTFVGVQARGCSPIARAFSAGKPKFRRWEKGRTIAHAISNPDPPGGNLALKLIRENGGRILSVTDREILSALRILAAEEGLFCEAASSTTLAALLKLAEARLLKKGQTAVLVITGSGLKTLADIKGVRLRIPQVSLSQIEEKIIQFIKGGTNER